MKRIVICKFDRDKDIEFDHLRFQRYYHVTDLITDEKIRIRMPQGKSARFMSIKTGTTVLKLRYKLEDESYYPLLLNKKQIKKIKLEYPEYFI